jgi:hypothetical protein
MTVEIQTAGFRRADDSWNRSGNACKPCLAAWFKREQPPTLAQLNARAAIQYRLALPLPE